MTLLFHAPCFDGLGSAVLALDLLGAGGVALRPVRYEGRAGWLERAPVAGAFAVVDFLYHPAAAFWADHHPTTFLTEGFRADHDARRRAGDDVHWDPAAPSCAELLWRVLGRPPNRSELVAATVKTDQAEYASPEEAVFGAHPALRIDRSLRVDADDAYLVSLVEDLAARPLAAVAARADVAERAEVADRAARAALEVVRREIRQLPGGILRLDWAGGPVDRYLPWLAADGRYSVVVARGPARAKLTVMRNPWRSFESVPLGELLAPFGGGGHARVGSALVDPRDADAVADEVVAALVARPADLRRAAP